MQIAAVSSVDDDDGWMHFGNTSVKFLDLNSAWFLVSTQGDP